MKLLVLICLLLCSCHQRGSINLPNGIEVLGVKDAGKPATLASSDRGESLPIPAGSTVTVTKSEALPATPAYKDIPAQKAEPAKEVTAVILAKDTVWQKKETSVSANTGTVDTSIREHQIDAEESRPLLYAAIGCALLAGYFLYRLYPTPAYICGGASGVFIIAWKATNLPAYFWVIGAVAAGGAIFLYIGHEKGLANAPKAP